MRMGKARKPPLAFASPPLRPERNQRRGWVGRAPKAPPPWPGRGLFQGIWLEVFGGGTGFRPSSSLLAQEAMGKTEDRMTATRTKRMAGT